MLFQGLKNKALLKRYNKVLQSNDKKFNPNLSHGVKTVGVIVADLDFDVAAITADLAKKLAVSKESISLIFFSEKELGEQEFLYFTPKNLDYKGKIKSETVSQFIYYPFDILINYSKNNNNMLNMVVALSKAKFKVGYEDLDNRLYQFMLAKDVENLTVFNNELFRYLKILKII